MGTLSILDLRQVLFGTTEQQVEFLQQRGLLTANRDCVRCQTPMALKPRTDLSDGRIFRCGTCKTTKSLRAGSFFDKSKLQLQAWLLLLYWWVKEYPVGDAAEEAKVSRVSAINVYQWLREVCSTKLLQIPTILGGQGTVVQIDESLFRHKPKVSEYMSKKCW